MSTTNYKEYRINADKMNPEDLRKYVLGFLRHCEMQEFHSLPVTRRLVIYIREGEIPADGEHIEFTPPEYIDFRDSSAYIQYRNSRHLLGTQDEHLVADPMPGVFHA